MPESCQLASNKPTRIFMWVRETLASTRDLLYSCSMGILHLADRKQGVTFIVWDGVVTWDHWLKHMHALKADPNWYHTTRFIADLQTVSDTSSISEQQVDQAMEIFGGNPPIVAGKRGALVAQEEFHRANKVGDLIARFGALSVTFNSLDTACIFLGLNLAETRRTLEQLRAEIRSGSGNG